MRTQTVATIQGVLLMALCGPAASVELQRATSVDPSGCVLEQVAVDSDINQYQYDSFSPDGQTVVYHEQVDATNFELRLLDLVTREVRGITDAPTEESYPSWSPDGKYIAFASDRHQESGVGDIFIMSRDGTVVRTVTDTPHKDGYPFWSPDGSYLYFTSYRIPQGVYRTAMTDVINCRR